MDDAFGVGVLHGVADLRKEFNALLDAQLALVAVLDDRSPFDQLHHEVGTTRVGRPASSTRAMLG